MSELDFWILINLTWCYSSKIFQTQNPFNFFEELSNFNCLNDFGEFDFDCLTMSCGWTSFTERHLKRVLKILIKDAKVFKKSGLSSFIIFDLIKSFTTKPFTTVLLSWPLHSNIIRNARHWWRVVNMGGWLSSMFKKLWRGRSI